MQGHVADHNHQWSDIKSHLLQFEDTQISAATTYIQSFGAGSTEKWEGSGTLSDMIMTELTNGKVFRTKRQIAHSINYTFNTCLTASPTTPCSWSRCSEPQCTHAHINPFYPYW